MGGVTGLDIGEIQGAQGRIEVKIEFLGVARLAITETSKLFCVSKDKFNLKPGLVIDEDLLRVQVDIGAEQQDSSGFAGSAGIEQQGNANLAFEGHMVNQGSVEIESGFDLPEPYRVHTSRTRYQRTERSP